MFSDLILEPVFDVRSTGMKAGYPVDHVDTEVEAIDTIQDCQLESRVYVALFSVAMNMKVPVIGTVVCEFVNQ